MAYGDKDRYTIVDNADGWSIYLTNRSAPVHFFSRTEWTRKQVECICELLNR